MTATMTSVLVDANVLLDIITDDQAWGPWSAETLERLANDAVLVIDPIVYAEVSVAFDSVEELDEALPASLVEREPLPYEAGFLAGKAFVSYRRRGGARSSPLPDFYIGAHAAIRGYRLLTRDARRFRTYFPALEVISPDDEGTDHAADRAARRR